MSVERTLSIIKPDAVAKRAIGAINQRFEKAGLLDSQVGKQYREVILEQGDIYPADKLVVDFLGRASNNKAFFKHLGLK